MDLYNKPFDASGFFSGGSGLFLQYYDIVKPIFLYAVFSIALDGNKYGLPIDIISHMSIPSIIEWYKERRYINPLYSLDYDKHYSDEYLDDIMADILKDDSIYKLSPILNISRFLHVYHQQHMIFPIYVYSRTFSQSVKCDIDRVFRSISHYYVYGDLHDAVKNCNENFTYIFSDLNLMIETCDVLVGTMNHILLARDYRYNYNGIHLKQDIGKIMSSHPFLRLGTTTAFDPQLLKGAFDNLLIAKA